MAKRGDELLSSSPTVGPFIGWICTEPGSPGSPGKWEGFSSAKELFRLKRKCFDLDAWECIEQTRREAISWWSVFIWGNHE